jgi:predicted nucleotidyltransferase
MLLGWQEVNMRVLGDTSVDERDRDAILAASAILKEIFPIEKVMLFGSKARGDSDEESDIDLLLLTTRPLSWQERREVSDRLFDVGMAYDVIFSTLDVTLDEWNGGLFTAMPIYEEISRDGAWVA